MTDDRSSEPVSLAAPKRTLFRNRFVKERPSPESLERQSRITLLAWNMLGADAAITFLNNYNDRLGARPLDLAVASAAGCEAVEHAISTHGADD